MNILNKVTLNTLSKNRTRTIVTIIGIILSVAMFTAVTTSISSLQHCLIKSVEVSVGSYHGRAIDVDKDTIEKITDNDEFEGYTTIRNIGYANINSNNKYKPYLYIGGITKNFSDYVAINISNGRMPENSDEILIPEHLKTNGQVETKIGDTLILNIGDRIVDGESANQFCYFTEGEKLINKSTKSYKIVGFYERPDFEDFSSPGYSALTIDNNDFDRTCDVFFKAAKVSKAYEIGSKYFKNFDIQYNGDLLRFNGISTLDSFNSVLYGFGGVLIFIIMLGSISLIYNAFSISVSERTKQFGLLKSIGATKKQILHSVLFEAVFLSVIGIPLGILSGIGGIGMTFYFTDDLFDMMNNTSVSLTLYVSWASVIIAAVIGVITVLISAYIPAKRASKKQAIDSIRQTSDIKIKAKKLKTSKLTYRLFGFSGMLAKKNFKRNDKKYRTTVISLTISIILFMTATTFTSYMSQSTNSMLTALDYDISYSSYDSSSDSKSAEISSKKAEKILKNIDGITGFNKITTLSCDELTAQENWLTDSYSKENKDTNGVYNTNDKLIYSQIMFIDDAVYRKYLKENKLDESIYMNKDNPVALVKNEYNVWNSELNKYNHIKVFKKEGAVLNCVKYKDFDGYYILDTVHNTNQKQITVTYENENSGEQKSYNFNDVGKVYQLKTGKFVEKLPMGAEVQSDESCALLLPEMCKKTLYSALGMKNDQFISLLFKADNHKTTFENMSKALTEASISTEQFYDHAESSEVIQAMTMVVNVFTYGFIILISLIAVANVFNTISTNISLRRREFAMLKSVGMTQRGFNKMMNYECLLYGVKSLIFGLPIGIIISLVLGRIMQEGIVMEYIFPYKSALIVIVAVFAVVFITCAYSMRKIKKESPIDALKNENI